MQKELFVKRIEQIEKAIVEKNKAIQQGMADLNVLMGCKTECEHWIKNLFENAMNKPIVLNEEAMSLDELKEALGADELQVVDNLKRN